MSASEASDYEQADQADHFNIQLLYSCLRHGKIGKVSIPQARVPFLRAVFANLRILFHQIDFQIVATELGLISKNAA